MDDSANSQIDQLAERLKRLGCPGSKSREMALQLDKRAKQLSSNGSRTYKEAMVHLLGLMQQGWAAQTGKTDP